MDESQARFYITYLTAMIDYYNGEFDIYANDMALFNEQYAEAQAWYRRNNQGTTVNVRWF